MVDTHAQLQDHDQAALGLWRDVTTHAVRAAGPDLTARQTAVLLTIYLNSGPHTVRALAKHLELGKPAIVRAIDVLQDAGLIQRVPDPADRRNIFLIGTQQGATRLSDYARTIARRIAIVTAPAAPLAESERDQKRA